MDSKFKRLASDTVIFAVGNILVKLIQFFLLPLYTSAMTTEQYGTAELINNLSELCYPLFCVCIYEALFRFAMDKEVDKKKLLSNGIAVLGISLPFGGLIIFFVQAVTEFQYSVTLFVLLVVVSLRMMFAQFARGIGYLKEFAISGIINVLFLFVFNLILIIWIPMGVSGYLVSLAAGNIISAAYLFFVCKLYRYFMLSVDWGLLRKMLIYCLPLIPNTFAWWFMNIFDRYVVLFFCGSQLAGIFTAACKLPSVINLCSSVFQQAWQISSARELKNSDSGTFFSQVFMAYSAMVTLVCSFLIVSSKLLAGFLLHGSFGAGWIYLPVLMLSAMFNSYAVYFGTMYNATKKTVNIISSTALGTIVNVALVFILIPRIGVHAAPVSMMLGNAAIALFRFLDTRKYVKININAKFHAVSLLIIFAQTILILLDRSYCGVIAGFLFVGLVIVYVMIFAPQLQTLARSIMRANK